MSIEGSSTGVTHKSATGDTSRLGKGKGAAGGASDLLTGSDTGFSALLGSFDPQAVADDGRALSLAKDEPPQVPQAPVDPLSNLLQQSLPNDLQFLLAQASEMSVDKSNTLQAAVQEDPSSNALTPTMALMVDALPAQAQAPMLQGLAGSESNLPLLVPAASVAIPNPKSMPASGGGGAADGVAGVAALSKAVPTVGILNPDDGLADGAVAPDLLLLQPGQPPQVRSPKSKIGDALSSLVGTVADSRMPGSAASTELVNREANLMGALISSGFGENLSRLGDRRAEKPSFSVSGSGTEGIWGQTPFKTEPAVETATLTANSSTSSLESMVADTVSYWVTQGVKHAALKLDGFGDRPLEVSISMQGGETHIDFRTDQPEIRQILEGAMTQLKDALKGEGVVLSGVSVGSSGQNGGGGPDERNRPGARQGVVVTTRLSSADSLKPVSLPAGRVLDLFV